VGTSPGCSAQTVKQYLVALVPVAEDLGGDRQVEGDDLGDRQCDDAVHAGSRHQILRIRLRHSEHHLRLRNRAVANLPFVA
jgi:hypothetical protein